MWPVPNEEVAVGEFRCVVVPSPSSPSMFLPQQTTEPSSSNAQACASPAEICVAVRPAGREMVVLGGDFVSKPPLPPPSPRRPSSSDPQHLIEPSSNKAQVKPWPRASEIAWRPLPSELIVVGEF